MSEAITYSEEEVQDIIRQTLIDTGYYTLVYVDQEDGNTEINNDELKTWWENSELNKSKK